MFKYTLGNMLVKCGLWEMMTVLFIVGLQARTSVIWDIIRKKFSGHPSCSDSEPSLGPDPRVLFKKACQVFVKGLS